MKFLVLFFGLIAVAFTYAEPEIESHGIDDEDFTLDQEPEIRVDDDGHFRLRLVDADGTQYEEEGIVVTDDKTGKEIVYTKKGSFSYPDKDGKVTRLAYDVDGPIEADGYSQSDSS